MDVAFDTLETLLAIALIAAIAPAIAAAIPVLRLPQVVILIFGGILISPYFLGGALDLTETSSIQLLSNIGLGFLFLLAGYELDPALLRQRPGRLAITGWVVSAVLSVVAVAGLARINFVHDFVPIALALTTTALGMLLPILREHDMLSGSFGGYVLAAGAVGELFPIVAISLFLTKRGEFVAVASLIVVAVAALLLTAAPRLLGESRLRALIRQGRQATAQTTLRWSVVLLLALLVLAERFGLDVVLGAMLAGIVLRRWTKQVGMDIKPLEDKLETVSYGVFIPIFFIVSGMTLDLHAIAQNPLRPLVFLGLLLVVRGLPALLIYRRVLPLRQRVEMTFITATTMPLLIALAEIGLADGVMLKSNAAGLVGAGVLSVLLYPAIAVGLERSARSGQPPAAFPASDLAAGRQPEATESWPGAGPEDPGPD